MSSAEREYYARRALQESSAADAASCSKARKAHLELANRYSERLSSGEPVATGHLLQGHRRG